jgi:cyclopropane fatty-acyl-phospholipid synthase-like methyltransferase
MTLPKSPWNNTYAGENKTRDAKPSPLAIYAVSVLKESSQFKDKGGLFILELGCGYGRDAFYLAQNLPCRILGLDSSEETIAIARTSIPPEVQKQVELLCYDFADVRDKFDIIFASNTYQSLAKEERLKLRQTVQRCLKSGGLLFLNALSVRDSEHFGKGRPVDGDFNAFFDERFLHFCTRLDLERDFEFLDIQALFEREYRERQAGGEEQHIYWFLAGQAK